MSGAAAWLLAATSAGAEPLRASVVLQGAVAGGSASELPLSAAPAYGEPDPLRGRDMRLDGAGAIAGAGYKIVLDTRKWRGGFGFTVAGASGFELKHQALAPGLHLGTGSLWGLAIDPFFGRQWSLGKALLYLELRAALNIVQAGVKLQSDTYGLLGTTPYNGWLLGIGPRIGLTIPLSRLWFIDTTVYGSPVGLEKYAFTLGLGVSTGRSRAPQRPKRVPGTW